MKLGVASTAASVASEERSKPRESSPAGALEAFVVESPIEYSRAAGALAVFTAESSITYK
jgi:hypothetical protein